MRQRGSQQRLYRASKNMGSSNYLLMSATMNEIQARGDGRPLLVSSSTNTNSGDSNLTSSPGGESLDVVVVVVGGGGGGGGGVSQSSVHSTVSSALSFDSNTSEDEDLVATATTTITTTTNGESYYMLPLNFENNRAETWMQRAWIAHFWVGVLVLLYSVWANGGSKYVPVDPERSSRVSGMEELKECQKLFVNTMASSREETNAFICCSADGEDDEILLMDALFSLCPPSTHGSSGESPTYFLPFLGRLAKFPDAWLIPLFPLLLRISFRTYQTLLDNGHLVLDTTFGVYSFRRLVFYFLLMQFRGWILYVALNGIEDSFFVTPHKFNEVGDPGDGKSLCWYQDWLQDSQGVCYGRRFDFSDHVVLYYAQLLPIALVEYLHSIHRPYWPFRCCRAVALLPTILTVGMLYLYFITYVGVYKTAAYFHTPIESLAGYAVSLLMHLPLCALQCSNDFGVCFTLREFFFGRPKAKVLLQ